MRQAFFTPAILAIAGFSLATLQPQATLAAAAPLSLRATSPWLLRYDEDRCRAVREFGSGDDLTVLWLDQSGIDPSYNLSIVGPIAGESFGNAVTVSFGVEDPVKRSYVKARTREKKPVVTLYGVSLAPRPQESEQVVQAYTPERQAAVDRIALSGGTTWLVLETGSLGEILPAMQTCASDLVAELGRPRSKPATPKGQPGAWLNSDDYPAPMVRKGEEGVVRFRLTIDAQGIPTACHVTEATRSEAFEDVTCVALLQRARFEPALDMNGKPAASYFESSVRFQIPR